MTLANLAGQFGDTTYTKVFVGGLAWEMQKETMKKYFELFGEILEAVVTTDKATRSPKAMDLYAASSSSSFSLLTFPCTRILEFISLSVDLETNERSSII